MIDLSRGIGGLEARMDEHEKRVDRIEQKIDEGFEAVNTRLDKLTESENRRKGAARKRCSANELLRCSLRDRGRGRGRLRQRSQ
jgi:hypothetical protein